MTTRDGDATKAAKNKNALAAWIRAIEAVKIIDRKPEATLPALFDGIAERHGAAPALCGETERLSYRELAGRANRYAHWGLALGLGKGDVVGLLLQNCPDYVAIWFGLTRLGCVVALINTNLVGDALAHCIGVAEAAHVIVGTALLPAYQAVADRLPGSPRCWVHGKAAGWSRIEDEVAALPATPPVLGTQPAGRDVALLIYTSGTTGLPKAANVSHGRVVEWSFWFAGIMDASPADRLYDCLPMYHSVGGVVAVGAMLVAGGSVVIRERFSATRFWADIAANGCTIFQYIGELCRYLLRASPSPDETGHRLRLCCGNGLAGDVWEAFQARFNIPHILEYYAATEGNVSLYNVEGRPGAIGRVPGFLAHRFPIALIKIDLDTGAPLREAGGLCIPCGTDEPGEAIGKIQDPAKGAAQPPARQFDGYTDAAASAKKILRDVFRPGDSWFRTGDLMRKDRAGYYIFVDRLGDTFRWKGENVSTAEVAGIVAGGPDVAQAVVFGVAVPGQEGRAGMAAITVGAGFSPAALHAYLTANLPAYAQPLFLRVCGELESTGTFKLKKDVLRREGFSASPEPVWFNDRAQARFITCDASLIAAITAGDTRF